MKIQLLLLVGVLYVTCAMLTSNLDKKINKYYKTITHPSVFDIGYYYLLHRFRKSAQSLISSLFFSI